MGRIVTVDAAQVAPISQLDHGLDGDPFLGCFLVQTSPEVFLVDVVDLWSLSHGHPSHWLLLA